MTDLPGTHPSAELAYQRYLDSAQWRRTRAAALMRAGHRCAIDATHRDDLEVRHNTRERLGRELDRDLVVLCADCRSTLAAAAAAAELALAGDAQNVVELPRVITADGSEYPPRQAIGTGSEPHHVTGTRRGAVRHPTARIPRQGSVPPPARLTPVAGGAGAARRRGSFLQRLLG